MMHLKNIKAGNAKTLEQYELTKKHGVIWLYSEDGKNWYEEVKNFQPDTIRMVLWLNGFIRQMNSNNRQNHKRPRYFPKQKALFSHWNALSG